jgi:hypothetical protein
MMDSTQVWQLSKMMATVVDCRSNSDDFLHVNTRDTTTQTNKSTKRASIHESFAHPASW